MSIRKRRLAVTLVALVAVALLAGCTFISGGGDDLQTDGTLGEVDGIAHDDAIAVDASDGLNATEQDLLVARAMARIESIRGLEFERSVDVEVITREQYRENRTVGGNVTHAAWNNQVWEGLFLVGENRDIEAVFNETFGASVLGYYRIGEDEIVIVSDDDQPTISKDTLVHELVHALQDQHFDLSGSPDTQDRQLARNGLVEGEAELIPELYLDRCSNGWSCVRPPTTPGGTSNADIGVLRVLSQPYTSGPDFVAALRGRGGWDAVDAAHDQMPTSTTQIIHPERYPDEQPLNVTVSDRSAAAWSRFDHDPVGDTLGEASINVMLRESGVIDPRGNDPYSHPVSEGWRGDTLVPYHNDGEYGYVWELEWDSESDASSFYSHYQELLDSRGAVERGANSLLIASGPFADAFRVTQAGTTVRIVNGPTIDSLSQIHAP
ncbi:Hvo_1808 family surface protein [Halovenus marina]|uniref:Hvo_1808 family surface protein n=1 Tax=Halovenus marina TaxID=3396621 RepID=UPI003F554792